MWNIFPHAIICIWMKLFPQVVLYKYAPSYGLNIGTLIHIYTESNVQPAVIGYDHDLYANYFAL